MCLLDKTLNNFPLSIATWQSYIDWDLFNPTWKLHVGTSKMNIEGHLQYERNQVLEVKRMHFSHDFRSSYEYLIHCQSEDYIS